jgi:hypothetical protein
MNDFQYVFDKIDEETKKHGFETFSDLVSIGDAAQRSELANKILQNVEKQVEVERVDAFLRLHKIKKESNRKINFLICLLLFYLLVTLIVILQYYKIIPLFL